MVSCLASSRLFTFSKSCGRDSERGRERKRGRERGGGGEIDTEKDVHMYMHVCCSTIIVHRGSQMSCDLK